MKREEIIKQNEDAHRYIEEIKAEKLMKNI